MQLWSTHSCQLGIELNSEYFTWKHFMPFLSMLLEVMASPPSLSLSFSCQSTLSSFLSSFPPRSTSLFNFNYCQSVFHDEWTLVSVCCEWNMCDVMSVMWRNAVLPPSPLSKFSPFRQRWMMLGCQVCGDTVGVCLCVELQEEGMGRGGQGAYRKEALLEYDYISQ